MGRRNQRDTKVNRLYYIDDLKILHSSEADLQRANEIVGKVSKDIGMRFGVNKCAEIVYRRGQMQKGVGLELVEGKVKALDPEMEEMYTFLGIEEGKGQMDKAVKERVTEECFKTAEKLMKMELYERNLVRAINSKAMGKVRYSMQVCHYNKGEIKALDRRMRKLLIKYWCHFPGGSKERLYLKRVNGGRRLIYFEEMYATTKIGVAAYLSMNSEASLLQVFRRERMKESFTGPVREAEVMMAEVNVKMTLEEEIITLNGETITGSTSKEIREKVVVRYQKEWQQQLLGKYEAKKVQSVVWKDIRGASRVPGSGFEWMKRNITSKQVASVLRVHEQQVETKMLRLIRGQHVTDTKCRLCWKADEGIKHWLSSCEFLAGIEYLKRHDQVLRVLYGEVLKKFGFVEKSTPWYNIPVEAVKENNRAVVAWNKRIITHTRVHHRWPDIKIEDKERKEVWILDMTCPKDGGLKEKEDKKRKNYQELAYDLRRQQPGWKVFVMPVAIGVCGALGGVAEEVEKLLGDERLAKMCVLEMQKVTVLASQQIIHRIKSGLIGSKLRPDEVDNGRIVPLSSN